MKMDGSFPLSVFLLVKEILPYGFSVLSKEQRKVIFVGTCLLKSSAEVGQPNSRVVVDDTINPG